MRLIATIGASGIELSHNYKVNNKVISAQTSFLALAEYFAITDIVLIGTTQSKKRIEPILKENPNIKMEIVEGFDTQTIFQKSVSFIEKDTILDLTQGFRHYPILTMLAAIFSQIDNSKDVKNIYYAQIDDHTKDVRKEACDFTFVSLMQYLDLSNMVRTINTFVKTLFVLDEYIVDENFIKLHKELKEFSMAIFNNNYEKAFSEAEDIIKTIEQIKKEQALIFINSHLSILKQETKKIIALQDKYESQRLLNISRYLIEKDITLHSITALYESMVAFLDEEIKNSECNKTTNKKNEIVDANIYQRRNCLKKSLKKNFSLIPNGKEFSKLLFKIDKLRNISAHAFTSDNTNIDINKEIIKAVKFLQKIYAQRLSNKSSVDRLRDAFK